MILGTTKDEGIIWLIAPLANHTLFEDHQENWDSKWGPLLMGFHDLDEATEEDLSNSYKLLDFYLGGLENLNEDHLQGVFDMYTDSAMLYGVNRYLDNTIPQIQFAFPRTAELLLSHGVRVWQYILTHQGQNSLTELFGLTEKVILHIFTRCSFICQTGVNFAIFTSLAFATRTTCTSSLILSLGCHQTYSLAR